MNFKTTSFMCQTCGEYAVTKCGGTYYAWHKQTELGRFDTADQARAACAEHKSREEVKP